MLTWLMRRAFTPVTLAQPQSGGVRVPARDAPLLLRRRAPQRGLERLLERLAAADREPSLAVRALESDADDHGVSELPQALTCMGAEARDLCHRNPLRSLLS